MDIDYENLDFNEWSTSEKEYIAKCISRDHDDPRRMRSLIEYISRDHVTEKDIPFDHPKWQVFKEFLRERVGHLAR